MVIILAQDSHDSVTKKDFFSFHRVKTCNGLRHNEHIYICFQASCLNDAGEYMRVFSVLCRLISNLIHSAKRIKKKKKKKKENPPLEKLNDVHIAV